MLNYGHDTSPKKTSAKGGAYGVRGDGLGLPKPSADGAVAKLPLVRYANEACKEYMQAPWENGELRSVVAFFVKEHNC